MSELKNSAINPGEHIQQIEGRGGLPELNVQHGDAKLNLCLQGAHITSYKPDGQTELLWMSQTSRFEIGRSVRGGIPLCWPWFGQHLQNQDEPQHGYARTSMFEIVSASTDDSDSRVVLRLASEDTSRQEKRTGLRMEFEVRLSGQILGKKSEKKLWMEIRTTNIGEKPASVGAALHTYFQVSDVGSVQVPKLKGLQYKDKTRDFQTFTQSEPLHVTSETDRVYLSPPDTVELIDRGVERNLSIQSWGNSDLVVWNPWVENASAMADFDDQGYRSMICIEPANALTNQVLLAPGDQYVIGKTIRLNQ